MKHTRIAVLATTGFLLIPSVTMAGGLRGSPASMKEQHDVAVKRDLAFIDDAAEVRALVETGGLEPIETNADYSLAGVSFPYALPEVKLLIERLGKQYHEANGAPLVVTSLTRPMSNQPRNAHQLSVHPAGMAVDFRVPQDGKARAWLESVLLQLENRGVLDVTRERFPPHYHVAVYPAAYAAYASKLPAIAAPVEPVAPSPAMAAVVPATLTMRLAPTPATPVDPGSMPLPLMIVVGMSAIAFTVLLARPHATV